MGCVSAWNVVEVTLKALLRKNGSEHDEFRASQSTAIDTSQMNI